MKTTETEPQPDTEAHFLRWVAEQPDDRETNLGFTYRDAGVG